jgi:NAD(P)-dependent dehydrogenase (short-subunit alcohol dehydrogenase family)
MPKKQPLKNKIALVAGATRGAGRGIAIALGEAGATVYCSGRSTKGNPGTPGRPETIEETAEMVSAAGGRGIAVRTDHSEPGEMQKLVAGTARSGPFGLGRFFGASNPSPSCRLLNDRILPAEAHKCLGILGSALYVKH